MSGLAAMIADPLPRPGDPRSRRDFLRLAGVTAVGGGAVFLGACGGGDDHGGPASGASRRARSEDDVKILNSALELEFTAVAAYTAAAPLLQGSVGALGRQFLGQEKEHAAGLRRAVEQLGGTPVKAKSADEYARVFPKLRGQGDAIRFAIGLENTAVSAYLHAVPKLSSGEMRQTAAAIVSNEAQHVSLLVGALSHGDYARQVPDAFVVGREG